MMDSLVSEAAIVPKAKQQSEPGEALSCSFSTDNHRDNRPKHNQTKAATDILIEETSVPRKSSSTVLAQSDFKPTNAVHNNKQLTVLQPCGLVSRQELSDAAHQLIEDINNKRKKDSDILSGFKHALEIHMDRTCSSVENALFEIYETQSIAVQSRLSELFEILERIAKLEEEMSQFKQVLCGFYKDVA